MGIPKCRLDVWQPTIGGTTYDKWVTAQNPENQNAVISVFILDKLANARVADAMLTNRAKNLQPLLLVMTRLLLLYINIEIVKEIILEILLYHLEGEY